jgi:competence protein ComEC
MGAMQDELPTAVQAHDRPASTGLNALPLFHAAWLFAAGFCIAEVLTLRPSLVMVALVPIAALSLLAAFRAQRIAWLPLGTLWLLLGVWCEQMEPHPTAPQPLAALSNGLARTVEGTIVDAGPIRGEIEQNLNDPGEAASAEPEQAPSQRIDLRVSTLEVVTDISDEQAAIAGGVRLTVR